MRCNFSAARRRVSRSGPLITHQLTHSTLPQSPLDSASPTSYMIRIFLVIGDRWAFTDILACHCTYAETAMSEIPFKIAIELSDSISHKKAIIWRSRYVFCCFHCTDWKFAIFYLRPIWSNILEHMSHVSHGHNFTKFELGQTIRFSFISVFTANTLRHGVLTLIFDPSALNVRSITWSPNLSEINQSAAEL